MNSGIAYLKDIVSKQKKGVREGVFSICSSNSLVLEAAMEFAVECNTFVLIESTANQVNQYGGYTGMTPADFVCYVRKIAEKTGMDNERIILGGDHLGPVVWKNENEDAAMRKASDLIAKYVSAGFSKIHVDTSMHLGDDDPNAALPDRVIALRAAALCRVAEETYKTTFSRDSTGEGPVYVIGSEVPRPGGAEAEEDELSVTKPDDLEKTIAVFKKVFSDRGIREVFDKVIAVVVQPGIEFGDNTVFDYDSSKAKSLAKKSDLIEHMVFEGHSTDYQKPESLRCMVNDGFAILKVGPELTFALREALFALCFIHNQIESGNPLNFMEVLDKVMVSYPVYWKKHYAGNDRELQIKRMYSYSDRCRYYYNFKEIKHSINELINRFDSISVPLPLLKQFLPEQYVQIREKKLYSDARSIIKSKIKEVLNKYQSCIL